MTGTSSGPMTSTRTGICASAAGSNTSNVYRLPGLRSAIARASMTAAAGVMPVWTGISMLRRSPAASVRTDRTPPDASPWAEKRNRPDSIPNSKRSRDEVPVQPGAGLQVKVLDHAHGIDPHGHLLLQLIAGVRGLQAAVGEADLAVVLENVHPGLPGPGAVTRIGRQGSRPRSETSPRHPAGCRAERRRQGRRRFRRPGIRSCDGQSRQQSNMAARGQTGARQPQSNARPLLFGRP